MTSKGLKCTFTFLARWAILAKWGHAAPNEWHRGSIFGKRGSKRGGDTEVNRQRYLNYLYAVNPTPKDKFWFKFHMQLEFGKEQTNSQRSHQSQQDQYQERQQEHKKPSVEENLPKLLKWWNILEVQPTDTKESIKSAYKKLVIKYHPDSRNMSVDEATEKMKLLNWAYEQVESLFTSSAT